MSKSISWFRNFNNLPHLCEESRSPNASWVILFRLLVTVVLLFNLALFSYAENLGPKWFDADNPAFGSFAHDITPEIVLKSIFPTNPKSTDDLFITVKTNIDTKKTTNKIENVLMHYKYDGGKELTLPLDRSTADENMWQGKIVPKEKVNSLRYYIEARDEVGNAAMEIPTLVTKWPPSEGELIKIGDDERGIIEPYSPSLDIISYYAGFDKDYLYIRVDFADKVTNSTKQKFAHLYGVGVMCPDIRFHPWEVNQDLGRSPIIGYVPLMSVKGLYNDISNIGGSPMAPADIIAKDKSLYMRAKKKDIAREGEDWLKVGIKVFFATGVVDVSDPKLPEPVDFANYILVYEKENVVNF